MLHYLYIERAFKRGCDSKGLFSGMSGIMWHRPIVLSKIYASEFLSVRMRCDSLGVRQNSLMIWQKRKMNVTHLSCA